MDVYNTACPRNCYSTCSFKVVVNNNRIEKIFPQPLNLATSEGPCLKGLSYLERVNSENRILYPLKKVGTSFIRISWKDALDEITQKLIFFREKYGSSSVLFYAASGMSGLLNEVSTNFWRMYGGATRVYGNLCWPAGLEATRLTLGDNKHSLPWDIENARLIILWGKNPAETNIHQMVSIERAQRLGAKLIVIDPLRTPSSEKADILIQPIPGTDGLLALTIAKLIIENKSYDADFVKNHVLGFDEFKESLKEISIERSSKICGISIELIHYLSKLIGKVSPMTISPGYGLQRYTSGGQTIRCLLALQIITGNIGIKGACWHYANLQSYVFDSVKEPISYYPNNKNDYPFRRSISTAKLGEDMLGTNNPDLHMAWVERGNPLSQNPDTNLIRKAFKKLDFVVVVEQFMTDTALEADIILPAKSMFEQSDIIGSYWNPYVQLKQKVVDPPAEVKPETEIYYLLAKKLGFKNSEIEKNIPAPNDKAIEAWLQKYISSYDGLSLDKLKEGPVIAPGMQDIAFSDMKFDTPSGKIELLSKEANLRWGVNELPTYDKAFLDETDSKFNLILLSPNTKNRIHSQFGNLNCIKVLEEYPQVAISNIDANARGIINNDLVKVYNNRGEVVIRARIDNSLRPGVVAIYNGYWYNECGTPNLLSKGRETDMGYGTAFHDNMVEIEKISENE